MSSCLPLIPGQSIQGIHFVGENLAKLGPGRLAKGGPGVSSGNKSNRVSEENTIRKGMWISITKI